MARRKPPRRTPERKAPAYRPFWRALPLWVWLGAAPLALLAAADAYFRFFVYQDALVYQDSLDPALGFELQPGAEGTKWIKSKTHIRVNSFGLRQPEFELKKSPDEFRVLLVGAGPSFALGLDEDQGFAHKLGRYFKLPRGLKLSVVNMSMYAWNLRQELAALQTRGPLFAPDACVLQVGADGLGEPPEPYLRFPRLKNFLRKHSPFLRWAAERVFTARRSTAPGKFDAVKQGSLISRSLRELKDFEWTANQEMAAATPAGAASNPPEENSSVAPKPPKASGAASKPPKAAGAFPKPSALAQTEAPPAPPPCLVLYIPDVLHGETLDHPEEAEKTFQRYARKMGFSFFNAAQDFVGRSPSYLLRVPGEPYLSARAQTLVAEGLGRKLEALAKARINRTYRKFRRSFPKLELPERAGAGVN